ncbi:MAG: SDR family NAD(P)-dependent oxidoreductase, partial [Candidatus Acidiferrales bacterium]
MNLKNQVAVVTGGAGRLGSQMCDALAEAGASVVVASRNWDRCRHKAEELSRQHSEAMAVAVD